MVDKMDLALLKQEIVDWHEAAKEGSQLMRDKSDAKITIPGIDKPIEFKTPEEQKAFRIGVILTQSLFDKLPFDVESDEDSDDE